MTIHGYCGKQNLGSPKTMHDNAIISWFEQTLRGSFAADLFF